jgi:hypothetical protein
MLDGRQMKLHVTLLAWLHIAVDGVLMLLGLIGFVFLTGIGILSRDPQAAAILPFIGLLGSILLTVLGLPGIVAGIGLLRRRSWGRILALIVGFFELFNVPIGTALGAYTFFVLLQQSATDYFAGPVYHTITSPEGE